MSQLWAKNFYNSSAWRQLRLRLIIENNFLCADCGDSYLNDSTQLVGHHITELTPQNINDVNISLNPDNIKIICRKCHDKAHQRFSFDSGQNVFIVYGAPCSGKNSYVNQIACRYDLIVDLDAIFSAISICPSHDQPNNLKRVAFAVRDSLIEQIRLRNGFWHNAFIIGGYPRKLQREQLAKKLGAQLIFIDSTREQAKATAIATRGVFAKQFLMYIDDWFDSFQP